MARIERVQPLLQRLPVQPTAQPQRQRDMVGFAHPLQLGQEPQTLLSKRQRQFPIARHRQHRDRFLRRRNLQRLGQHVQHRTGEQRLQRQLPSGLLHAVRQAHRHQRMPAQFEEVVVTANPFYAQQLMPDSRQQIFCLALRRRIGLARTGVDLRHRQGALVQFAVAGQRQRLQPNVSRRHHIVRQPRLQMPAQFGRQRSAFRLRRRNHPRHQSLIPVAIVDSVHGYAAHARIGAQLRFHLTALDAEAADFHLLVVAPQVFDIPPRQIARQIAGAIHARTRRPVERVFEKTFRRQFGPVQVPSRHPFTADVQFADRPHRHRFAIAAQQIQPQIRNTAADRAGDDRRILRRQRPVRHVHRGFGDAVHVDQSRLPVLWTSKPRREIGRLQHFTTEHDLAQLMARFAVCLSLDKGFEGARRLIQYRDAAAADEMIKVRRRTGDLLRYDEQLAAIQPGAPDLPNRKVEGE